MQVQHFLKDGRECFKFPWDAPKEFRPWRDGYERVLVPFTSKERMHARGSKRHHVLIVKSSNIRTLKQKLVPRKVKEMRA